MFAGMRSNPWVYSIVEDSLVGWGALWMATDDGVWVSYDGGKNARNIALRGFVVSAMAKASGPDELIGVVGRSAVFRLRTGGGKPVDWLNINPVSASELPEKSNLSRFTHDLHFGRGLFSGIGSLLINDIGGITLAVLSITGFLLWLLPKRWKEKKPGGDCKPRKKTMRQLFSLHATVFGLISITPIVYLSITGIVMNHRDILGRWMRSVEINRTWLTPAYKMQSWDDEIYSIVGYHEKPNKLSLGTRTGMYTTNDGGSIWKRETLPGAKTDFVWFLRRMGNDIFISPTLMKSGSEPWRFVNGAGLMPSDVTKTVDGKMVWKTYKGVMLETVEGKFINMNTFLPLNPGVSWFYVLDGLHSGLLIHPQWKWVNDIVAIMAILLCATGFRRWLRRKRGRRLKPFYKPDANDFSDRPVRAITGLIPSGDCHGE